MLNKLYQVLQTQAWRHSSTCLHRTKSALSRGSRIRPLTVCCVVDDDVLAGLQHGGAVSRNGESRRSDEGPECNNAATAGIWLLTVTGPSSASLPSITRLPLCPALLHWLVGETYSVREHSPSDRRLPTSLSQPVGGYTYTLKPNFVNFQHGWKEILADIQLSRIIAISKKIRLKFGWMPTFSAEIRLKYCTSHNKLEKNCHCQSTTVTNKADNKCSAVCTQHTWVAVSTAHRQIYSTSQVDNLCKIELVIVMHKTDTLAELFWRTKIRHWWMRISAPVYIYHKVFAIPDIQLPSHHRPSTSTSGDRGTCVWAACPGHTWQCSGWDSNPWPLDHESWCSATETEEPWARRSFTTCSSIELVSRVVEKRFADNEM